MGYINSPLGVKDTSLLEDLSNNGDGRVDRVGNDQDVRLGAVPILKKKKGKAIRSKASCEFENIFIF